MKRTLMVLTLALSLVVGGCASKAQTGALIGTAGGAAAGAAVGSAAGNTLVGALMGAAIGGAAGLLIGNYMDQQAAELEEELEGVTVTRVGEGIKLTFASGLLFAVNKSDLTPTSQENLVALSRVLNKYPDTNVLIEGHTDADGAEDYNQQLSERRASSVKAFLAAQSVSAPRMTTMGYGESQPVADNATTQGKAQNRRVEVAIMANEELKKKMEKQAATKG